MNSDLAASAAADPIAVMQRWLERAVIGLNLCPFAKAVQVKGQIAWVLSDAQDETALLADLRRELVALAQADPQRVETTLLVHPRVLTDFLAFNGFLARADALLARLGLQGELQIASFHPDFEFADAAPDDAANGTNRAPLPCLHLLRESSIERAVASFPDAAQIYERNIETMRALGADGFRRLLE